MKKFYVVGNKSSKSLSPIIFNYWFKKYNIDARYFYLQLNSTNFDKSIKRILKEKNLCGLNITIPFKKKIIKHVDVLDNHSKKINAVNCITTGTLIRGINTDWIGYYKSLPAKYKKTKSKILLIGYGGAALAIHYVLQTKGFRNTIIFNRSKRKINFINETKFTKDLKFLKDHIPSADIIINTTPKNPIEKKYSKLVKKTTLLSDIVYSPKETAFLKNFPQNNKVYGIFMLLEQAVLCFKHWFGFVPKIDSRLIKILDNKIK